MRNIRSAVTKLTCDDVYITSLSKEKALGVLALMLLDGEEKARIKRRNRCVWVRGWINGANPCSIDIGFL